MDVTPLPLYRVDAPPGAMKEVIAPGGFECWIVETPEVRIEFWLGFASQDYLRRHARYTRRPTRNAPAIPVDSPALRWVMKPFVEGRQLFDRPRIERNPFLMKMGPCILAETEPDIWRIDTAKFPAFECQLTLDSLEPWQQLDEFQAQTTARARGKAMETPIESQAVFTHRFGLSPEAPPAVQSPPL